MRIISQIKTCSRTHVLAIWIAVGLAGCSVVESNLVNSSVEQTQYQPIIRSDECVSEFGSYQLSKDFLRLTVTRQLSPAGPVAGALTTITPMRAPDSKHTYCLDFLESLTADDNITISKVTNQQNQSKSDEGGDAPASNTEALRTPYLQLITSKTVDTSAIILEKLSRIVFTAISGNPTFAVQRNAAQVADRITETRNFDFYPFDLHSVKQVNRALRPFGLCVSMGAYTYNTDHSSGNKFCSDVNWVVEKHPSISLQEAKKQDILSQNTAQGIFYRPEADYGLYVYGKPDPGGRDPWRLLSIVNVKSQNLSPLLAVRVDRAFFAARDTALVFDDGILTNVCISKSSELEGALEVPIEVIRGIASIPAQTITQQIAEIGARSDLAKSQRRLLQVQQDTIEFLDSDESSFSTNEDLSGSVESSAGQISPGGITPNTNAPVAPGFSASDSSNCMRLLGGSS